MSLSNEYIVVRKKSSVVQTIIQLLIQLRPRQWTKNLLVFGALMFSADKLNVENLKVNTMAFFLFCFIASCVYIINDFVDRKVDQLHPDKANRPMASGRLNPYVALSFGGVLFVGTILTSFYLNIQFGILLLVYFGVNVFYSLKLKHVVILDLMIIASGFVIRAMAGVLVIGVNVTSWFLMCIFLLSLFLAIGKRRHELLLLRHKKGNHRKVLKSYSEALLNQMSGIVTTLTIMSYSLYTFMSNNSMYLMWTIPCVIYGMFRYLYLIHVLGKGGKPETLLYEDRAILICILVFSVSVVTILKFNTIPI
jgi:4-hydroxybenzoate polyprenyltransferase